MHLSKALPASFISMPMDSSTNCQNRKSPRSKVLLAATLEVSGRSCAVRLRNLSEVGALVEGDGLPIEGTNVTFCRNELNAAGRVVWVDSRLAGIAFEQKLQPEQVLRHVPPPRTKFQPRSWRPGFTKSNLTAEQRRLAESWVWSPAVNRPGE
jgi:hypothetical protein